MKSTAAGQTLISAAIALGLLVTGCYNPTCPFDECGDAGDSSGKRQLVRIAAGDVFPYKNASNWWRYSEAGGNRLAIQVSDAISDDRTEYYKVSFAEERIDTTDDFFRGSREGIYFSESLTGDYALFLPSYLFGSGTFACGEQTVWYQCFAKRNIGGISYDSVAVLEYNQPVLHNFDRIAFAAGVGIVALVDDRGRFPITYTLDSAFVDGRELPH